MTAKKHIHVAVGVVINEQQQILLAKRGAHQHQGGLWEFPGGKVETGETTPQALTREFQEEVNISIHHAQPLMEINHDYGDKAVCLDVWISRDFSGQAHGNEDQQIAWVAVEDLHQYSFPKANKAILERLQQLLSVQS